MVISLPEGSGGWWGREYGVCNLRACSPLFQLFTAFCRKESLRAPGSSQVSQSFFDPRKEIKNKLGIRWLLWIWSAEKFLLRSENQILDLSR